MNNKQRAFVEQYVVDKNATQAAIRAGYSKRTAGVQGHDLLKKPNISKLIETKLAAIAKTTETDAEWVRRRLREEATNFSKSSTQAARVRAVELIAKLNGQFELDNRQKNPMTEFLASLSGNVARPVEDSGLPDDDD